MKAMMTTLVLSTAVLAAPAYAEFQQITNRDDFVSVVSGKTLTRPLVKLKVSPSGTISGKGATWDVSGQWQWKGNYLCRSLYWGGDDMGYNCQEVKVSGNKVRITSDRGTGQSAEFRLR
ncbi:dihydrodipicolinate reductase [Sulfitobacter aestuariivivens]|uniref:Dihydrodipicolinate reductase n=1 Tax=Sulfitobacter aestuariivivens TaxID=2766981 RepID=A0A927D8J5_9RHOB|nr:dihydrodipicolinate reductase [Sulfitobacter aestuariivivens]MBD3665729.1 dihydrodipicolinate reductase [Sulfitobacter aestuariivivens]